MCIRDSSSTVSHLSPLVDLSRASLKTISNRVEYAAGQEDRFGRRDQILEFYPVYQFTVTNTHSGVAITTPGSNLQGLDTLTGVTSNASGKIVKVDGSTVTVVVKTTNTFQAGETLKFTTQTALNDNGTNKVIVDNSDTVSYTHLTLPTKRIV